MLNCVESEALNYVLRPIPYHQIYLVLFIVEKKNFMGHVRCPLMAISMKMENSLFSLWLRYVFAFVKRWNIFILMAFLLRVAVLVITSYAFFCSSIRPKQWANSRCQHGMVMLCHLRVIFFASHCLWMENFWI